MGWLEIGWVALGVAIGVTLGLILGLLAGRRRSRPASEAMAAFDARLQAERSKRDEAEAELRSSRERVDENVRQLEETLGQVEQLTAEIQRLEREVRALESHREPTAARRADSTPAPDLELQPTSTTSSRVVSSLFDVPSRRARSARPAEDERPVAARREVSPFDVVDQSGVDAVAPPPQPAPAIERRRWPRASIPGPSTAPAEAAAPEPARPTNAGLSRGRVEPSAAYTAAAVPAAAATLASPALAVPAEALAPAPQESAAVDPTPTDETQSRPRALFQQLRRPPVVADPNLPTVLDALETDPHLLRGAREAIRLVYRRFAPEANRSAVGAQEGTTVLEVLDGDPYLVPGAREAIRTMYERVARDRTRSRSAEKQ